MQRESPTVMTNLVLSLLLLTAGCVDSRRNKLLLVSMDGFRWDYVKSIPTPNLDRLAGLGTRTDYVNNTFCTKTFPSHFSVATGKSCFRSIFHRCNWRSQNSKKLYVTVIEKLNALKLWTFAIFHFNLLFTWQQHLKSTLCTKQGQSQIISLVMCNQIQIKSTFLFVLVVLFSFFNSFSFYCALLSYFIDFFIYTFIYSITFLRL